MCFVCAFLIATLPTVILADGGGADCSASFEPPPAVHDPLSFGVVRMSVPKTPSEAPSPSRPRGGRRNQKDYRTEFIFLNSSGWPQATELLDDAKASILTPSHAQPKTTKVIGLAETHLLPPEFVDKSHSIAGQGWQTLGAPAVKTDKGGYPRGSPLLSQSLILFHLLTN